MEMEVKRSGGGRDVEMEVRRRGGDGDEEKCRWRMSRGGGGESED